MATGSGNDAGSDSGNAGSGGDAFEERDLISLGEKLASLELNDAERAALASIVSDDDVAGFARYNIFGGIQMGIRRHNMAQRSLGKRAPGVRIAAARADWDPPIIHPDSPGEL